MNHWLLAGLLLLQSAASTPTEQMSPPLVPVESACPARAVVFHRAKTGETVALIARQYRLDPATVLGANPQVQTRPVRRGDTLRILPRDGILYRPGPEEGFLQVSQRFRVSPDLLFEANGCQMQAQLFVPGVRWQAPPKPKPQPRPPQPSPAPPKPLPPMPYAAPVLRLPPPPVAPRRKPIPLRTTHGITLRS